MNPRNKALIAAGSGIAVGIGGLVLTTLPAGADDEPVLPEIGAEELVASALEAEPPAFEGRAELEHELGLPAMTGMDALDIDSVRVFHDGAESARVQVERQGSEQTFVKNTDEVWVYDSREDTADHLTWDEADAAAARKHAEGRMADPSRSAADLIEQLRPTSEIVVDGTARVADRAAYELVLTPKPSEKTLLREVTVAIDSETRLPLRFEVFANGSSDPVASLGFTEFTLGEQDAELFEFTAPEGAKVREQELDDAAPGGSHDGHGDGLEGKKGMEELETVGEGWDTVVIGEAPEGMPAGLPQGELPEGAGEDVPELGAMLGRLGAPVSGEFGTGTHIEMAVGGAVIASDGRVAAGAVPQQVLVDALEQQ